MPVRRDYLHFHVCCNISHNSQDTEITQGLSTDEWIKKMWNIHTMEYYSAMTKKEILPLVTTWMNPEATMLSETNQSEKDNYHMIPLICGI